MLAEGIDLRSTVLERQVTDGIHDLHELRVTMRDRVAKLVEFTSTSSKRPRRSDSEPLPRAEFSMKRKA